MGKIIYTIFLFNFLLSQDHWETAIFASDEWKYIVPDAEPRGWAPEELGASAWRARPSRAVDAENQGPPGPQN